MITLTQPNRLQDMLDCKYVAVGKDGLLNPDPASVCRCTCMPCLWCSPGVPLQTVIIQNARILLETSKPSVPTELIFTTGNTYVLSDGYSVIYCKKLANQHVDAVKVERSESSGLS